MKVAKTVYLEGKTFLPPSKKKIDIGIHSQLETYIQERVGKWQQDEED